MFHRLLPATIFLIAASGSSSADPIFSADWNRHIGKSPEQWKELHAMETNRLQAVEDPTGPRGGAVIEVEVRPGDKFGGWSGERAEFCGMRKTDGTSLPVRPGEGHEFYALSVKPDADWQAPQPNANRETWGTFFQLHGPDRYHASPAFALMAEKDFHVNLCVGDLLDGGKRDTPRNPISYPFNNGALKPGTWTEF